MLNKLKKRKRKSLELYQPLSFMQHDETTCGALACYVVGSHIDEKPLSQDDVETVRTIVVDKFKGMTSSIIYRIFYISNNEFVSVTYPIHEGTHRFLGDKYNALMTQDKSCPYCCKDWKDTQPIICRPDCGCIKFPYCGECFIMMMLYKEGNKEFRGMPSQCCFCQKEYSQITISSKDIEIASMNVALTVHETNNKDNGKELAAQRRLFQIALAESSLTEYLKQDTKAEIIPSVKEHLEQEKLPKENEKIPENELTVPVLLDERDGDKTEKRNKKNYYLMIPRRQ